MPIEIKKGSELRGRYVISDLLGEGAFALVWRATDKQASRDVAIKRLLKIPGNELGRIVEEANRTARVKGHKNIVEMYEVFTEDDEGFLVMEYVDGTTLENLMQQHIRAGTWFQADEAVDILKQVLEGLVFAHSSGLFHRDVKPSNILVSKLGVVKLVDFGLARPMVGSTTDYIKDHHGLAWTGTPNFMSPEQARGESLDHQTDIFSAGLVGYILLTGSHPFNHPSAVATVFDLIREPAFLCKEIPPEIKKLLPSGVGDALSQMLEKDKSRRCGSLIKVLDDLTREAEQLCPKCGSGNPTSANFCQQCGQDLRSPLPAQPTKTERPPDAAGLTEAGFQLTREGEWEKAIDSYKRALAIDPAYALVYSNLGFAFNHLGMYEEAIAVLTEGMAVTADPVLLHRMLDSRGFAKSKIKDYEGAITDFSEALRRVGTNPRVYYHRAESEALMNRFDEAYNDTLVALRFDPNFAPALRLKQTLEGQGYVRPLGSGRRL
jgi:hypothetical protein